MSKIVFSILLFICSFKGIAQDKSTIEIKNLVSQKQYTEITKQYAPKATSLSAKSLYYIGLAYYMQEDDNNCLKFMNMSIEKDKNDPEPFGLKAQTLNYLHKYEEAIPVFQSALALDPNNERFLSGLGDAYYNLKKHDLALETYKKAIQFKGETDRPYSMIAQIYSDQKKNKEALEAFYLAKSKISKDSDSYLNALYNIGLLESLKGNHNKAEPAFIELIQLSPDDFHAYAKLIQIYYKAGDYEKAKPFKMRLYESHRKGLLKDNLEDMFCFDQFTWNDKLIQAYERYEEGPKDNIFNKHQFYVLNKEGEIDYRIQTEYSPVSVEQGGTKYLLCTTKGKTHATYNVGFNDDFEYGTLKKSIIDILENKIQPVASSTKK